VIEIGPHLADAIIAIAALATAAVFFWSMR